MNIDSSRVFYCLILSFMKKLYLFITLILLTLSSIAQDIIVTNQSERIECKVIEISETQVSYKKHSNLNGPLFTMSAARVASIIFENGEVYTFNNVPAETEQSNDYSNEVEAGLSWQNEPEVETQINLSSGKVVTFRSGTQIEVVNGKTYYGNSELNSSEYNDFLKQTCPAAYQEAMNAERVSNIAGFTTLLPGTVLMSIGLYKAIKPLINGDMFEDDFDDWNNHLKPMLIWFGAGLGCVLIGIPIMNRSIAHSENARIIFNRDCSQAPQTQRTAQLSLGISPVGAGLTLTF